MGFPVPANEDKRLEALKRYGLLDTGTEQSFDDFAHLASHICGTPIASVTLLDANRQWFKAKVGLESTQTPREHAFCSHTILSNELMVVTDASVDKRFANNPLVTSDPNIRFYAGAPLIDSEGFGLGSLCVIDRAPRHLTKEQEQALMMLARQVVAQCEFRRISADLALALSEVKTLRGLLPICTHCKSIKSDKAYWSSVDQYLENHNDVSLSHGVCPACLEQHYPEYFAGLTSEEKMSL